MSEFDPLEERVRNVLSTYTLEELLELNEIEVHELVLQLVNDGTIILPDLEPL
jgi:hypothetical protein